MAVTITNKFYDTTVSGVHDIAKIVFTSPNLASPSNAGTRSHILPGQGALGLWYEDTSKMYKKASSQYGTIYNPYTAISGTLLTPLDLDNLPATVTFDYFPLNFKEYVSLRSQASEVGTVEEVSDNKNRKVTPSVYVAQGDLSLLTTTLIKPGEASYEYDSELFNNHLQLSSIGKEDIVYDLISYTMQLQTGIVSTSTTVIASATWTDYGWISEIVAGYTTCYILFTFEEKTNIFKINLSAVPYAIYTSTVTGEGTTNPIITYTKVKKYYFIGNFTIQGSNDSITWTTLYTGANTTLTSINCYFTSTGFYLYYRICILNTTGLNTSTFNTLKYGLKAIKLYKYVYSLSNNTDNFYLYNFNNNFDTNIVVANNFNVIDTSYTVSTGTQDIYPITGIVSIYNNIDFDASWPRYYTYDTVTLNSSLYSIRIQTTILDSSGGSWVTMQPTSTFYSVADVKSLGMAPTFSRDVSGGSYSGPVTMFNSATYTTSTYTEVETTYFYTSTKSLFFTIDVTGTVASGTSISPVFSLSGTVTRNYNHTIVYNDSQYELTIVDATMGSGVLNIGTPFYLYNNIVGSDDTYLYSGNSVIYQVTAGECYNCRLTAWDDITHSTTLNKIIASDRARIDAMAYCGAGTSSWSIDPIRYPEMNFVFPPVHNRILKGNVVGDDGYKYYYGDFDLKYRTTAGVLGDFLMFRPFLYNIDETVPYGVHDFFITLHYSYT